MSSSAFFAISRLAIVCSHCTGSASLEKHEDILDETEWRLAEDVGI